MLFKRPAAAVLLFSILLSSQAFAVEVVDDLPARQAAIEKYFSLVPFTEMTNEMTDEVAKQLPPENRAEFVDMMKNEVRWDDIVAAAKSSMVKHFSLAEIQVLTEFMSRPEGKSAMSKMKFYMADLMPVLQAEIKRVILAHQAAKKADQSENVER